MPPSTSLNWFITISTRTLEDVDSNVVHTMVQGYQQYYCVIEYGQNHDHPHYHLCLWGQKAERQDVVRRRWIQALHLQDQDHSVRVTPITDGNSLIGKYLQKDDYMQVFASNLDDDLITRLKDMYSKVEKVKVPKKKHLTISDVADSIVCYAKAHGMPLDNRQHCTNVVSTMYQEGYRFLSALSRMRQVWAEIQMISGRTIDQDDIFFS